MDAPSDHGRWVVGITDHIRPPANIEQEAFPEAAFRFLPDWRAEPGGREAWREADALLVWHWVVDRETVALLDRCKIAVRYGVGFDLVDVPALAERNILVQHAGLRHGGGRGRRLRDDPGPPAADGRVRPRLPRL